MTASKALPLVFSANTGKVWNRSISALRSELYRADVSLDIKRGMTRDELAALLDGCPLPFEFVANVGDECDPKAIKAVVTGARKAAKVHQSAKARAREAACGHRNCAADTCRWV